MQFLKLAFFLEALCLSVALCAAQSAGRPSQGSNDYTPGLDLTSLDRVADPCVDFYQFACGGWLKNNPLPPDQSSWGQDSKVQDRNRQVLRQILEDASHPDPKRSTVEREIGDYYSAWMNRRLPG
jgi:putative endopeptidase